jgi:Cu/Ag efflux pump CusA
MVPPGAPGLLEKRLALFGGCYAMTAFTCRALASKAASEVIQGERQFDLLALMGVAVLTSVILYSFINKLRMEGNDIITATYQASLLRLRPIMMTALVACIGLLPAATSTGIGSDSQKPFAIVIVRGLLSRLLLSIFLSPILYAVVAREDDVLKVGRSVRRWAVLLQDHDIAEPYPKV